MEEALLATAGDTIKLWDASSHTFYQEIPFETGHVRGLAWNQDGQCLASVGDSGEEVFLSAICGKSEANIGVVRGIETPTCLKFACRSPHYLGVGSASGTVTIWNIKAQTKKKVFTPTDRAITKIAFSHSDSHIATATKKGTLYMLSIVNNVTAGPYQIFNNQVVTDLTYSRVKKSLVGCCSDGGSVSLFDTHASKMVHSFSSAHSSPVAGVAFSPVNELLMVSVGYDKKLSCYNVQTRQPVITHRSAAPLTSVTFLGLGQLVALGTMTGQVFIHDMRSIQTPFATLKAHRTAVTNVLLQPSPRSKSASSSKAGQRNNTEATLAVPNQKPSKQVLKRSCSDQPTELSPEMKPQPESSPGDKFDLSVFSPIRETNLPNQVQTPQASGYDQLPGHKITSSVGDGASLSVLSPIRTTDLQHNNQSPVSQWMVDINEDNVLSPIRDTTLITKTDSDSVEIKPSPTVEVTPAMEVTDKENIEPSVSDTKDQISVQQQTNANPIIIHEPPEKESLPTQSFSHKADARSPCVTQGKVSQDQHLTPKMDVDICENLHSPLSTQRPIPASDSTVTGGDSKVTKSNTSNISRDSNLPAQYFTMSPSTPSRRLSPPKKRQLLQPVQAADLDPDTPPGHTEAPAATTAAADTAATSHGAPQLQMELVRSCMVDVLEEFQDELNRRLMHMQYIMTKKFIQQQEVMEKLHRQYSLNEDLMKENEQLRQQIAHLQAKY
ncbi:protein NEDD1-like isoform X1 [Eriocheir sinensis]|uniref:protein NEDD1-like isoform X1 n=1 Tax=Eriocheir sinensis TaxID=95602 RepID=UPI0021C5F21B|nr:protein NEDD1-like isoform X1 [Eriocheir sinensis]XP_050699290.1 protein NEDD1-like isoform X1 [Eriocheir sinensis]XP_050699291.1 protein NEDD1-like isoform X1 [Eriocheir sinensis]XP_050699292.1 protein NEDD1-like isoform X1 [Eriocheir sinensis]